jgi:hypothetical protein
MNQHGQRFSLKNGAHLVFLQHHEVEMTYALLCILTHAFNEGRLANNVAYILVYHIISGYVRAGQMA